MQQTVSFPQVSVGTVDLEDYKFEQYPPKRESLGLNIIFPFSPCYTIELNIVQS